MRSSEPIRGRLSSTAISTSSTEPATLAQPADRYQFGQSADDFVVRAFRSEQYVTGTGYVVRTEHFRQVGGFPATPELFSTPTSSAGIGSRPSVPWRVRPGP